MRKLLVAALVTIATVAAAGNATSFAVTPTITAPSAPHASPDALSRF